MDAGAIYEGPELSQSFASNSNSETLLRVSEHMHSKLAIAAAELLSAIGRRSVEWSNVLESAPAKADVQALANLLASTLKRYTMVSAAIAICWAMLYRFVFPVCCDDLVKECWSAILAAKGMEADQKKIVSEVKRIRGKLVRLLQEKRLPHRPSPEIFQRQCTRHFQQLLPNALNLLDGNNKLRVWVYNSGMSILRWMALDRPGLFDPLPQTGRIRAVDEKFVLRDIATPTYLVFVWLGRIFPQLHSLRKFWTHCDPKRNVQNCREGAFLKHPRLAERMLHFAIGSGLKAADWSRLFRTELRSDKKRTKSEKQLSNNKRRKIN